jgi:hypothetical protein
MRASFFLVVGLAAACSGGGDKSPSPGTPTQPNTPAAVSTVSVSLVATVAVGATTQLTATPKDAAGNSLTNRVVDWSTSNATIATVSQAGLVTGVTPGSATITATVEGVAGTRNVNIIAPTLPQSLQGLSGSLGTFAVGFDPGLGFEWGFSFYTSIHKLQDFPAANTQLGWGTWLKPDTRGFTGTACPDPQAQLQSAYQTIEGGAGVWTTSKFPSPVSKFRLNSTPNCYRDEVGSTAWTFYGNLLADDKLYLAQLSNRILVPADGIVFQEPALQAFLGYGWMALPLIPAHVSPNGVATGDQSWTLFFNTTNFAGPIAFYVPDAFSAVHAADGSASRGLDTKPAYVHSASMEFGTTRSIESTDATGARYLRIPRIAFPADAQGRATMIQDPHRYSKAALWNAVAAWMAGGAPATQIAAAGMNSPILNREQTTINIRGLPATDSAAYSVLRFTTPGGGQASGMRWGAGFEAGVLPEYYKFVNNRWTPVPAAQVPRETWLSDQRFNDAPRATQPAVSTTSTSPWTSTKWRAGPFTATLSDGSSVDYVWYKFNEQPAIARLNLSGATLAALQTFVEAMHDQLATTPLTFAAPTSGSLATIDPAQLVTPPAGLTRGYVPIVIRQQ